MSGTITILDNLIKGRRAGGPSKDFDFPVAVNGHNALLTAQDLPPYAEMSRRYNLIQVQSSTLFAPLVAVPTTTAAVEAWVNISCGSSLVVTDLFADQILATAAAQEYAIYAQVTVPKAVPSLTALAVTYVNGDDAPSTPTVGAPIVTGVGTTVVANGWRPYGPPHGGALAAATPMGSWEAPIDGRLIVRPGRSLCLHVVGSLATASSFQVGFHGYMVPNEVVSRL